MPRILKLSIFLISVIFLLSSCGVSRKAQKRKRTAEIVINTARAYTGTPYVYGGTDKRGIDCSGLVCQAYQSADIVLPRTSKQQSKVGKKVKTKKLREGDLLFFAMGKRKRKITHVGIVTAVNNSGVKFIHSSSSQGVVEKELMREYYLKRLRKARRIIK